MPAISDMEWGEYRERLRLEARRTSTPAFGTFELTPLCNFNCKMCYVHLSYEQMKQTGRLRSADEWVGMAEQASDLGTFWITLTGGEVLTREDFSEIYSRISDLGIRVSVLSNGYLINEETICLFSERPPAVLRFTLYGSTNDTYRRLCGVDDGFDRVYDNLLRLRESGIKFRLAFTRTSLNNADCDEVISIARDLGVHIVVASDLVGSARGATNDVSALRVLRSHHEGNATCEDGLQTKKPVHATPKSPFWRCGSYRSSFWLDWDGNMEMCGFMSSCRTKPFEWGMKKAWNELLTELDKITFPKECTNCDLLGVCYSCPGICEADTGSPEVVSRRICESMRERGF